MYYTVRGSVFVPPPVRGRQGAMLPVPPAVCVPGGKIRRPPQVCRAVADPQTDDKYRREIKRVADKVSWQQAMTLLVDADKKGVPLDAEMFGDVVRSFVYGDAPSLVLTGAKQFLFYLDVY